MDAVGLRVFEEEDCLFIVGDEIVDENIAGGGGAAKV